jgi:hypothetical protein
MAKLTARQAGALRDFNPQVVDISSADGSKTNFLDQHKPGFQ